MRIRRFDGATMGEALAQVKAALGPEAVILDTVAAQGRITVTAAVDRDAPAAGEDLGDLQQLLGALRELIDLEARRALPDVGPELRRLHRVLLAQGVDAVIANELVRETAARLVPGTALDTALARTVATRALAAGPARVRLFVGPPGDGKTTTIAKLAAQARRERRRVALVSTDTYRVGGAAELATYGRALGVPVTTAADPEALARALAAARDADLVLIDTAGAGAAGGPALAELVALAEAAGKDAGCTLVASAATGRWAAVHAWQVFGPLRPDACVLTKLDVAPGGPMLGILWRRRIPVSHLAGGRRIPDDLECATAERLARCLLAA
jgi:flagellar biosynthesis protein FlhF